MVLAREKDNRSREQNRKLLETNAYVSAQIWERGKKEDYLLNEAKCLLICITTKYSFIQIKDILRKI